MEGLGYVRGKRDRGARKWGKLREMTFEETAPETFWHGDREFPQITKRSRLFFIIFFYLSPHSSPSVAFLGAIYLRVPNKRPKGKWSRRDGKPRFYPSPPLPLDLVMEG
jgi:hypothetical protein